MSSGSGTTQPHASAVASPPGARVMTMATVVWRCGTLSNAMRRRTGEWKHYSD
ncbi:MAG: hypothetical protein M3R67_08830 [Acidobacteriota bacterium]|nr:hypothetical protein [Acidobacteriota bacterium]